MSKTSTFNTQLSSDLIASITTFIDQHHLVVHGQTVIIGLSGGPDSLFLLHILTHLRNDYSLHLIAAHLDHGWRDTSADDVLFCKTVAEELGVKFIRKHAHEITISKPRKGSLEEQGRLLRRTFFKGLAAQYPGSCIALGHHADDQQETFFIRLLRGSGITGLSGIKNKDGIFIHPLLCCSKQTIIEALEKNNIAYLIDPTNESDQFLRNRIRRNIIPALRKCDARFDESLRRTMENLRETDDFLEEQTHTLFTQCTHESHGKLWLALPMLFEMHPFMQKKILLAWCMHAQVQFTPSSGFFNEILQFLKNKKSNHHTFYNSWQIIKKGNHATIEPHQKHTAHL